MLAGLIPTDFFETRPEWLLWLLAVGAIPLLVYGADRLVAAAVALAEGVGMPKVIIGATIVSLGTTSPEAAVSVRAAWDGQPGLALGNGLGSIICNAGLIFGLCCCVKRLPLDRFVLKRHGWLQFACVVLLGVLILLLWLLAGGPPTATILSRWVGVLFAALLVGYMCLSIRWARQHPGPLLAEQADAHVRPDHNVIRALLTLAVLVFGLSAVVFGSDVLVGSVTIICENHDVPKSVLAGTMVAFGTSLPELVTAIASIAKGHPELLVGNIVGANILNVLFVIGFSAMARPLRVDGPTFYLLMPVALVVLGLMRIYVAINGSTYRRWQGVPLVVIYAAYVVVLVAFGVGLD